MTNVGSIIVFVCLLTTYCGCERALYCSDNAFAVSGIGTGRTRGTIGVIVDCVCAGRIATCCVVDSVELVVPTKSFILRAGAA